MILIQKLLKIPNINFKILALPAKFSVFYYTHLTCNSLIGLITLVFVRELRYGAPPTMHCFEWDILYWWSYGVAVMKGDELCFIIITPSCQSVQISSYKNALWEVLHIFSWCL